MPEKMVHTAEVRKKGSVEVRKKGSAEKKKDSAVSLKKLMVRAVHLHLRLRLDLNLLTLTNIAKKAMTLRETRSQRERQSSS